MDKNKIQELRYLMQFYHIENMPLFYKHKYCGKVTEKMEYDKDDAFTTFTDKEYAFECAYDTIHDVIKIITEWNKSIKANVNFVDRSWGWIHKEDGDVFYGQKNEVKQSVWEGTLDEICERMEKKNNRLRYCNGLYYEFKDEDMRQKYLYWRQLIPYGRSFALYYPGNTVVD